MFSLVNHKTLYIFFCAIALVKNFSVVETCFAAGIFVIFFICSSSFLIVCRVFPCSSLSCFVIQQLRVLGDSSEHYSIVF